ncbi:hypothetical protein CSAL01_04388 [Colletotrichum salicis]|uniref:Catechol dioxygenase N-terminal domain-containing protein n=1 Tax=Colletotrichum salicis TaxID=1209931 RepID=A0A135RSJ7_9PEZI|nr:hypothetical protein CSAL01_04388 [Colletotrichum salicis]
MDFSTIDTSHPPLKDLTTSNITQNVHAINAKCNNPRTRYLFQHLVTYLHDFARDTNLTTQEWETAIAFLTDVGKTCTPVRQEFVLLSEVLGLSLLIDSLNHPKPQGARATDGTVLGPFHTHEAKDVPHWEMISRDGEGEPMLVGFISSRRSVERSDAVFGVKESLVVDLGTVSYVDGLAEKYGVEPSTRLLTYDFVLVSEEEVKALRESKSRE